jgi:hypothetical protein
VRTQEDLTRTLRSAAALAEEPVDLLAGVGGRRRRRTRQRIQVALAVAGVAIVATGVTVATRGGGGHQVVSPQQSSTAEPTSSVTVSATVSADLPDAKPAKSVWPEAVTLMPKKTADGFKYRPVTALSPTEILLTAESSFEKAGRLEVYDTATGTSRVLTELVPHQKGYFEQHVEVGEDYIAWYGITPDDSDRWADFWVAPRQGGPARKVGEVTGAPAVVDQIGVSKDHVVWSAREGGVYRMPIAGGAPEKIAGTDGLWLAAWPWAADVPGAAYSSTHQDKNQSVLRNLVTGEQLALPEPEGVKGLRCSPEWCVGVAGFKNFVVPRAGGEARTYSGHTFDTAVHGGRFVITGDGLYDLVTGRTGKNYARAENGGTSGGRGTSASPTSIFYWNAEPLVSKKVCRKMTKDDVHPEGTPPPGAKVCEESITDPGGHYEVINLTAVR